MRLLFLIATYQRPDLCLRLVRQIYWQCPEAKILVVDDGSTEDYREVIGLLSRHGGGYRKLIFNHGKKGYWRVVDRLFQWASEEEFDYAFKLDDDVLLHPNGIDLAVRLYQILVKQREKIVLNMWVDHRAEEVVWVGVKPRICRIEMEMFRRVGWIDGGNWLANRKIFEILEWHCPEPPAKWWRRSADSSGVGKYLSVALMQRACHIYQPMESLIYHGDHPSQMHPDKTNRPIEMKEKPWLD